MIGIGEMNNKKEVSAFPIRVIPYNILYHGYNGIE